MRDAECGKLFNSITDIDGSFIEEAQEQPARRKRVSFVKLGVLAACVCLLAGTAAAVSSGALGMRILDIFTARTEPGSDYAESGFDLSVDIERVPVSELTGGVQEVGDEIVRQFREDVPYSSWYPGHWQREFASSDDAIAYIGYGGLKRLDWALETQSVTLNVYGDGRGRIHSLDLETRYSEGGIRLQFFSDIFTEHYDREITAGVRTTESVGFAGSVYTAASGKQCLVISDSAMESGYMGTDAYLVDGGVLYSLHAAYLEDDAARALELVKQWAELF